MSDVRKFLPPQAKLAFDFVLAEGQRQIIYVENFQIKEGFFDGRSFSSNLVFSNPMLDDGLSSYLPSPRIKAASPLDYKFRIMSTTDKEAIQLLTARRPSEKAEIAIGVDVVLIRNSRTTSFEKVFILDYSDWSVADSIVNILNEYPLFCKVERVFIEENIEQVFRFLFELVGDSRRTRYAQNAIGKLWGHLKAHLQPVEYHPLLSVQYQKLGNIVCDFLTD